MAIQNPADILAILESGESTGLDLPVVHNPQMPHLPILFLLDCSASMNASGNIDQLNKVLQDFVQTLQNPKNDVERKLANTGDYSIITYGDDAELAAPWTNGSMIKSLPTLVADGSSTHMGKAIIKAHDVLSAQLAAYKKGDVESYCGYVFNLTDGGAHDLNEGSDVDRLSNAIIRGYESIGSHGNPYVQFFHFAAEGADMDLLHRLAGDGNDHRVIDLRNAQLSEIIRFVVISIRDAAMTTLDQQIQALSKS